MVTLIDLKKAKMTALKNHDSNAQSVLGIVIASYQKKQIEKQASGQEMTDADMLSILNETVKELTDEKAMYENANRKEEAANDQRQIEIIKAYLPKMMEENEVRSIIENLEDKSIKNIMAKFKTEYSGKADMAMVSRLAKEYQK